MAFWLCQKNKKSTRSEMELLMRVDGIRENISISYHTSSKCASSDVRSEMQDKV
jgi:hypothetical protein